MHHQPLLLYVVKSGHVVGTRNQWEKNKQKRNEYCFLLFCAVLCINCIMLLLLLLCFWRGEIEVACVGMAR